MNAFARMRSTCVVVLGPALCGLLLAHTAVAQDWQFDLDKASARARAENRLLLVDFWADWCGPCHAMDDQAWGDPKVRALSERFVLARVDFGQHGNSTTEFYGVDAIPTVMVLNGKGVCLVRTTGFRSAGAIQDVLRGLPVRATEADSLIALAGASAPSVEACLDRAALLTDRQALELSARACKQAQRMLEPSHADSLDERLDMLSALSRIQREPGKGLQGLQACLDRYPNGRYRREQHAAIVRTMAGFGNKAGAEEALAHMKKEFPDDSLTVAMGRLVAATSAYAK